jgi:hypothetical protein
VIFNVILTLALGFAAALVLAVSLCKAAARGERVGRLADEPSDAPEAHTMAQGTVRG